MNRINVLATTFILLFTGCIRQSLDPKISFHNNNVLLPTLEFSTSEDTEAYVEYWPRDHTDRLQRSGQSTGKHHRIILVGVTPSTTYDYTIHTSNPERVTNTLTFSTSQLPAGVTQIRKQLIDTTQFNGYVLVRRLSPQGVDVMLNNAGDIVWYHMYDSVVRRPFNWTSRNTVLSEVDTARIVEYDLYGDAVFDMDLKDYNIPNMLHHDAAFDAKGDIVALTHDSVKMDLRKFGYGNEQFIRGDGIVVITTKGKKVSEWNILNVYDPHDHPNRKLDLTHSLGHANSLAIASDGNYVVSFRDFSQVWKINASDGSIMWTLGDGGDLKLAKEGFFLRQHAVCFNDQGELMLFDNGDRKIRPESRVLSFVIDEQKKEAVLKTKVVLPRELSAEKMCSAVSIEPGKYLVCTTKKNGIITVVNDSAEVLWRVDLSNPSYRAYYLDDPFTSKRTTGK
ncbi:aryl-sulfate sulfotransferase [Chryseolinea sp. T2]|uniref:aryl-sulfate sulfotransferase n=1 Tax=Chryseolinea sp. T2 TaxID=3129255 RepID=UPI0030779402